MKTNLVHLVSILAVGLYACASEDDLPLGRGTTPPGTTDPAPPGTGNPPPGTVDPSTCSPGRAYNGMAGANIVDGRAVANAGVDRGRFKPYSSLAGEFQRVLGNTPASLAGAADTYGRPEARWYDEPAVGSVVLQTSYSVAYDGCITYTETSPDFAAAPTAADAPAKCAAMARKFWSRTASPDQIAACADVAVSGSAAVTDVRKRWAYACASVITSAGFLTY